MYRALLALSSSRLVLLLPLALAAFALVLHVGCSLPTLHMASNDIIGEAYFQGGTDGSATSALSRSRHLALGGVWSRAPRQETPPLSQPWHPWSPPEGAPERIAFCATAAEPLADIRAWLNYARALGVTHFYLFTEGRANLEANVAALQREPGVTVIRNDEELARAHASSRIWSENWLSSFFHKPCNYELFVRQSLNMEIAIRHAARDGVDWILHIDTDELIWPGGSPHYSLAQILAAVESSVDVVVFPNYEAVPERDDVKDPFLEVTLFKRNFEHVDQSVYFSHYREVAHDNGNFFLTYGNGKAAARVQKGLRPNGAHRWQSYLKVVNEITSAQAAVLHYTYNRFSDLKARRDRCDCAPNEEDAKRCFILPFDRAAYLASSLMEDRELRQWFKQHLLWDDPDVVDTLLHAGIFVRLYEPQLMIRGFWTAFGRNGGAALGEAGEERAEQAGGGLEERAEQAGGRLEARARQGQALAAARDRASAGDRVVNSTLGVA